MELLECALLSTLIVCGIILALCLLFSLGIFISDLIHKIYAKDAPNFFDDLNKFLIKWCEDRSIPITYGEQYFIDSENNRACGTCVYTRIEYFNNGIAFKNFRIYIRSILDRTSDIFTLAHEIGHVISIGDYHDESEYGADYEAFKLVESFLETYPKERVKKNDSVRLAIDIFLNKDTIKDFSHARYLLGFWKPPEEVA